MSCHVVQCHVMWCNVFMFRLVGKVQRVNCPNNKQVQPKDVP